MQISLYRLYRNPQLFDTKVTCLQHVSLASKRDLTWACLYPIHRDFRILFRKEILFTMTETEARLVPYVMFDCIFVYGLGYSITQK